MATTMDSIETGYILKDIKGNVCTSETGSIRCFTQGGIEFQIPREEIDFTYDTLQCIVGDKTVIIKLHNNEINKENNTFESTEFNKNEVFAWTDASTKLFLSLYKEKQNLLTERKIKTRKVLWQKIAETMQDHGYNVTNIQVENKFKSLERSYKNMKCNNKQTGRSRATCLYETRELTELLSHKHNIEPLAVSGSEGVIIREDMRASTSQCDTSETSETMSMDSINTDISVDLSDDINKQHSKSKILTSNNDNNHGLNKISSNRTLRRRIGPTGRFLEKCQQSIEKLIHDNEEERNIRVDIHKELLTGYKETNKVYEEQLTNITKELQKSNMLKEEKNNLLKEYINIITSGIAYKKVI